MRMKSDVKTAGATYALRLQSRVTCPHCWHGFPPEDTLWVARHPELLGDPRLGGDAARRFLPTRFTVDGDAIDAEGFVCNAIACPQCHLNLPRAVFEMPPLYFSILGAPASGKSYFLAAMTWQLRQQLSQHFHLSWSDVEPTAHVHLNAYEERLFLNSDPDELVSLPKTDVQGEHLYDTVQFGEQLVIYPPPFVFALRLLPAHPLHKQADQLARSICLYDNAGEHFLPGADKVGSPVTQHLALSRVMFCVFDPTQDPRMRELCRTRTLDPQMGDQTRTYRQETILLEAADRVRKYAGLAQSGKHSRPLIVVVTKADAWCHLLGQESESFTLPELYWKTPQGTQFDTQRVDEMSRVVRSVLAQCAPEFVSAAESFAEQVIYIPVSALGRAPELDPQSGQLCVRPREIQSAWVEAPMVYALQRWGGGLIPAFRAGGMPQGTTVASRPSSESVAVPSV